MNGGSHRLAAAVMRRVQRLTPVERQEWALAMAAEFLCMPSGGLSSLDFAVGCLWAAVRLRANALYHRMSGDVAFGCVVGALFFVHAAYQGSRAWPLMWPAAGGAIAVLIGRKKQKLSSGFPGTDATMAAATAIIFFLGGVAWLWWRGAADLGNRIIILGIGAGLGILLSLCTARLAAICIPKNVR